MRYLGLSFVLAASIGQPAVAAERWPYGDTGLAAYRNGDYAGAWEAFQRDLVECEASEPAADECLNLLFALSNTAIGIGNLKAGKAMPFAR